MTHVCGVEGVVRQLHHRRSLSRRFRRRPALSSSASAPCAITRFASRRCWRNPRRSLALERPRQPELRPFSALTRREVPRRTAPTAASRTCSSRSPRRVRKHRRDRRSDSWHFWRARARSNESSSDIWIHFRLKLMLWRLRTLTS